MSDFYEFAVEWPSTSAKTVIVTGDFDKWSKSLQLSRSSGNDLFTATIKVPYGCPTRYKFIVDGEWAVKPDQPTEYSPEGYLNNIHYVPLKAPPTANSDGKAENRNGTVRQSLSISDVKDAIVASAGTSGALNYVTSGIGESVRSVVGVDPFNSNQIAIPTPITASASIGLPSPALTNDDDATSVSAAPTTTDSGAPSPNSTSVAPLIPIGIVPVYSKENCTIDPSKIVSDEESIGTFVGLRPVPKDVVEDAKEGANIETSNGDTPISVSDIPAVVTEPPAEETTAADLPKEGENSVVEVAVSTEEDQSSPAADAAEPTLITTSEPAAEEAPTTEQPPKADERAAPAPPAVTASTISAEPATSGHTHELSSPSTKVVSSSRPTTPTGTFAPTESVTSTPTSTVRRSKVFPSLGKGSPSKASSDEFGVKDGKSTGGKKKKRTSSFFANVKKLFHHEHHDKDKEKSISQ